MKTTYIIFLLFLCFGSAKAQSWELEISSKDTINKIDIKNQKQGNWIIRGKHWPGSGYSPDHVITYGYYKDNRKDGVWIEYSKNSKMKNMLTYVNGTLNGPALFFDDKERIVKQGSFENNKWVNKIDPDFLPR